MLRPTKGMHATPLRRRRSPALRFGQASDGGSEGMAQPDPMIDFAELDAQNCSPIRARSICAYVRARREAGSTNPPMRGQNQHRFAARP
ncbi:hypothetical protein ACVWXO_008917 [Bradyrhizobium sp. LM2.7]